MVPDIIGGAVLYHVDSQGHSVLVAEGIARFKYHPVRLAHMRSDGPAVGMALDYIVDWMISATPAYLGPVCGSAF